MQSPVKITSPAIPPQLDPIAGFSRLIASEDNLEDVKIENESFHQSTLQAFSIANSRIMKTDFTGVEIHGFGIKNAVFGDCDMTVAKYPDASWHTAQLHDSRCSGMQLDKAVLKDVLFKNCKLDMTNLRFAKLVNIIFDSCVVNEMDFYNADLKNIAFINCDIDNVEFSSAKLHNVDLTESRIINLKGASSLRGATINNEQLIYLAPYLASEFGIKVSK